MSVFADVAEDIAGKLTAAGVTGVTLDPRGQLPCVLVDLARVTGGAGIGGWTAVYEVKAIVPPPGDLDAVSWLYNQLELVLGVFPGSTAEPRQIERGDALAPGYVVDVTVPVPNPNC